MNLTDSIAPKSDQLDAIELVSGPRTFTIEKVSANNPDQPFNFHLKELDRVWRPGKSMRRVIVAAWGAEASAYVGQQVTLYCDPTVRFGNDITGGTRISHMTGIDKPLKVSLMVSRGKFSMFTVMPLETAEAAAQNPTLDTVTVHEWTETFTDATTLPALQAAWETATKAGVTNDPRIIAAKDTRKQELA